MLAQDGESTVMSVDKGWLEIADCLANRLCNRLGGRLRNLRILIENGAIVLQGQATTYYVKQLAQHIAMETTGLAIRANEIEVR